MTTPNPHTTKGSDELERLACNELDDILDRLIARYGEYIAGQPVAYNVERKNAAVALLAWADKRTASTASSDELREQVVAIINDAVNDLGMTVLFKDEDPVDTGVGDKHPPYYWTDKVLAIVATANREVLDAVANAIQSSVEHMVLGDGRRDEIVRLSAARAAIQKIREGL